MPFVPRVRDFDFRFGRHAAPLSQPSSNRELKAEEERLWTELHLLVDSLPEDKVAEPG